MENVIKLREAEAEDCDDFLRWRNHPEIRRYFFTAQSLIMMNIKNGLLRDYKAMTLKSMLPYSSGRK